VDVRLSPFSPNPTWRKPALERALGDRYVHLPAFGNRNYKVGGTIELADPEAGTEAVRRLLTRGPVALMCACASSRTCHRRLVAELICERLGLPPAIHWTHEDLTTHTGLTP
jgi:hypothetical protein